MSNQVDRCPKCGSDEGFYTKARATQALFYRFGESEAYDADASSMRYGDGVVAYCQLCDRPIGRAADLIGGGA